MYITHGIEPSKLTQGIGASSKSSHGGSIQFALGSRQKFAGLCAFVCEERTCHYQ